MLYDITICDQINPIGVDKTPLFSWKIKSNKQNIIQTSYEIRVKSEEGQTVWSTGRVHSEQSTYILYSGKILKAEQKYYVDIRVWDNKDDVHFASTTFETGLLTWKDSTAKWICDNKNENEAIPVFTKRVRIFEEVKRARIYATACGVYEIRIDDKKISDTFLAPGWTSYESRIQYRTYDVTGLLEKGEHDISIIVAPGWYAGYLNGDGEKGFYGDRTAACGVLSISYADGKKEKIATDESWDVCYGSFLTSEIYHGEKQDLTSPLKKSHKVSVFDGENSVGQIVSQESESVRIVERIKAKKLLYTPKHELVIDFGQNMAGIVEVKLPKISSGKTSQHIVIRHAETLDKDGNFYTTNLRTARATDEYIYDLTNENTIVYPHFTYHGFRYIAIEEIDEIVDKEEFMSRFTACALHTDMKAIGSFSCDNEDVNKLQQNILWGQRSNFVDIPTDCPQRDERLGWTGDAAIFCETGSFNYFTKRFFEKWINDVAVETDDEHGVPHLVPSIVGKAVGTAVWSDCATIIPWQMYMSYGDKSQLLRDYPLMKQWVDYVYRQCDGSILWLNGFQRGDWLALDAPASLPNLMSGGTDKNLVANVFYAYSTKIISQAARALGLDKDFAIYEKRFNAIVDELNEEYVTPRGRLVSETQTACALLLHFGFLKEKYISTVKSVLKDNLIKHKNHLTTGFVGTPFLLQSLSQTGMHEIAEEVFYQKDYPGWFYAIEKGATTIWERWNSIKEDGTFDESGMNSLNHYSYGAVGSWLYQKVGGISPIEPGYKKSRLSPTLTHNMTNANTSIDTVYGKLSLEWSCTDGYITVKAVVPENTTATLILPEKGGEIELGSGTYTYHYETATNLMPGKYTKSVTYGELLANQTSAEILYKVMPEMKDNPMIDFIKGKTLAQMEAMAPDSSEKIDKLLMALNECS